MTRRLAGACRTGNDGFLALGLAEDFRDCGLDVEGAARAYIVADRPWFASHQPMSKVNVVDHPTAGDTCDGRPPGGVRGAYRRAGPERSDGHFEGWKPSVRSSLSRHRQMSRLR
jgi:hypothetical protein